MNQTGADPQDRKRGYDAFISYSRRDRDFAVSLQHALQNYQPPKETRAGGRRLRVFRDEADFSGIEYEESVARHLDASAKLIVVCSPHARSSTYVDDEIRRFAALNGAANIVPVLIAGVPNNEAVPDQQINRAFPEALCELFKMPVASDFRGCNLRKERVNRGRFEAEWFRTLANLLDEEPAAVEQRERKRRARLLKLGLAGSTLVIGLLTLALVVTLISRREAVYQRAQVQRTAAQADFDLALLYSRDADTVDPRVLAHLARALRTKPDAALPRQYLISLLRDVPWRPQSSKPMRHEDEIVEAIFSPDSLRVATASADKTARLWEAGSGDAIGQSLRHAGMVLGLRFSPDGERLLTWSEDGTARLWNGRNGEPVGEPLRHEGPVLTGAFSPDGRWVVTGGSLDRTARVWHAANGQPRGKPLQHLGGIGTVWFSPDSERLFTTSFFGTTQFWDVTTGQLLGQPLHLGPGNEVLALSPDSSKIVVLSRITNTTLRILETQAGQQVGKPLAHEDYVRSAAFSPNSRRIVTASADSTARVWDAESGESVTKPLRHTLHVIDAVFSPEGNQVATASADGTARIWDVLSGAPIGEPVHHDADVQSVAFSPDGRRIVTASDDRTARVWYLGASAQTPLVLGRGKSVVAARFLGSSGNLITASSDSQIRVWDLKTTQLKASRQHPVGRTSDETWAVGLSANGARVVVGVGSTAQIWDFETERLIGSALRHEKEIVGASFSPDGGLVVTASWDKTARLWDTETGRMVTDPLRHEAEVQLALFSPDGRRTVTADAAGAVWIWDVERGALVVGPIRHPQPSGFTASVGVALDQEGRRVATVETEGSIQLWDAQTGQRIGQPFGHVHRGLSGAASVAFSPDGLRVATVTADSTLRLWDARTGYALGVPLALASVGAGVHFSEDGRWIVAESEDGAIVLDVAVDQTSELPVWVPELAEALAGKRFDQSGALVGATRSLTELRNELLSLRGDDFWSRLGRWFLVDGPERTLSPMSNLKTASVLGGAEKAE
jgi:WD40 repeat protein